MRPQESPYILDAHTGVATSVAFHPRDPHTFCSGGLDGKVNLCTTLEPEIILTSRIADVDGSKSVNCVGFNYIGDHILAAVNRRFSIIDVDTGQLVQHYDNVAFPGRERIPLAVNNTCPHVSLFPTLNGKGIVTIDSRQSQPAHFAMNVHPSIIKDIAFLDSDWPIGPSGEKTVVSLSRDGVCKFTNLEFLEIFKLDVKHRSYCLEPTPEFYLHTDEEQCESHILMGGDKLSCYRPAKKGKEPLLISSGFHRRPMNKIRYLTSCYLFYTISCDEVVRQYRRRGHKHEFIADVYSHKDKIMDMVISPVDEYLVTCSKNGQLGVLKLGTPSTGGSQCFEYA